MTIKHDPDRDPLAYERVVRADGSFDAEAMHAGLDALIGQLPDSVPDDLGGQIGYRNLTTCLTALASVEAMRTFLVASLARVASSQTAPIKIIAADVNDLLEAVEHAAVDIAAICGLRMVHPDGAEFVWRLAPPEEP